MDHKNTFFFENRRFIGIQRINQLSADINYYNIYNEPFYIMEKRASGKIVYYKYIRFEEKLPEDVMYCGNAYRKICKDDIDFSKEIIYA